MTPSQPVTISPEAARLHGNLLLVDDEPEILELTAEALRLRGHTVRTVRNAADAIEATRTTEFDVVLADLHLDGVDGLDLCARLRAQRPMLAVVVVTGDTTLLSAIAAIRAGAFDYLTKPVDLDTLARATERALKHHLQFEVPVAIDDGTPNKAAILGKSAGIRHVLDVIARIATTNASVLVTGESGTGKELVARALHLRSQRAKGPFVALNCAALPHELLESELFGHARGAFTDARSASKGLFLEASGGTLFLDEIGEMPLSTQVKLLRALQERTVRPVGGTREVPFDARLVTATNRDLADDVVGKRFREDLYYRINVVTIAVPPLRQRRDDIPALADAFLRRFAGLQGKRVQTISPAAMEHLLARSWPGNVRELENTIERAVSMSQSEILEIEAFVNDGPRPQAEAVAPAVPRTMDALVTADVQEGLYLQHVLSMVGGNKSRAAEVLGYDRRTLHRKLKRASDSERSARGGAPPALERPRPAPRTKSTLPAPLPAPSPAPRVLVVDGDVDARNLLQSALDAQGYRVIAVSTMREALLEPSVDVVVTALALRDGGASELAFRLGPTPVIVLSARSPSAEHAFAAWLPKPSSMAAVLAAIEGAMKR